MSEFLAAAQSVYSFIRSTAEKDGSGFKWRTYDYSDTPHYHFNIFNGVGGIPIFLGAYYHATRDTDALDLAYGALEWCRSARSETANYQRGVQFGKTGVAFAALYLSEITGENRHFDFVEANAAHILAEEPGPITDFIGGEASNGWFLLKLWRKSQCVAHLDGAIRCAEWIEHHLTRDELGTHCLMNPMNPYQGERPNSGLSHGIAGVAFFYSLLFEATRDSRWKRIAYELLETLMRHALPDRGGRNWSRRIGNQDLTRCQYSHGAPGIGLVFSKAADIFEDINFREIAIQAGEATYQYGDSRRNPTLCTGLAGSGELFVELFRVSGDRLWLSRAEDFATLAITYRIREGDEYYWPTDTPGCYSADFTYGAAGTGYFLLRTSDPSSHAAPLM